MGQLAFLLLAFVLPLVKADLAAVVQQVLAAFPEECAAPVGKGWVLAGTDSCGDLKCQLPFESCAAAFDQEDPVLSCEAIPKTCKVFRLSTSPPQQAMGHAKAATMLPLDRSVHDGLLERQKRQGYGVPPVPSPAAIVSPTTGAPTATAAAGTSAGPTEGSTPGKEATAGTSPAGPEATAVSPLEVFTTAPPLREASNASAELAVPVAPAIDGESLLRHCPGPVQFRAIPQDNSSTIGHYQIASFALSAQGCALECYSHRCSSAVFDPAPLENSTAESNVTNCYIFIDISACGLVAPELRTFQAEGRVLIVCVDCPEESALNEVSVTPSAEASPTPVALAQLSTGQANYKKSKLAELVVYQ